MVGDIGSEEEEALAEDLRQLRRPEGGSVQLEVSCGLCKHFDGSEH
jgi:hypothetical protein